jgi:hypothetical protein
MVCLKDLRKQFQECETLEKPLKGNRKLKLKRLAEKDTTNHDLIKYKLHPS